MAVERRLETVACPLCDSRDEEPYLAVWDRFDPDRRRRWKIRRCRSCGLLFLNPRPALDDLGQYYQAPDYDPFAGLAGTRSLWDRFYVASRRLALGWKRRVIERWVRPGRLLDVGCGTGEFLSFTKEAGWQVQGLEPDARAARFASEERGVPVQAAGVDELARLAGDWDVITFWHVLEHLPQPVGTLRQAAEILAAGGHIFIALPNPASLDARFYGHRWVAWDAPRHLVHFTRSTVERTAEIAGLEIAASQPMPLDPFYNSLMSERFDPHAVVGFKWLRGLGVAMASWIWGQTKRTSGGRGSSELYMLRPKRRGGR